MSKIAANLTELVGNTPLLRLSQYGDKEEQRQILLPS